MITAMSSEFFPSFTNVIIPANDNVQLFARIRGIDPGDRNKPILVLIHGYPQSFVPLSTSILTISRPI